jgi:hypothetical protein
MTAFTQTCTESISLVEVLVNVPDIDTMARWVNLLDGSWSAATGGTKPGLPVGAVGWNWAANVWLAPGPGGVACGF